MSRPDPRLYRQLAADYCCSEAEASDERNHYNEHVFLPGRRRYEETDECFFRAASVRGKLLATGDERMMKWCRSFWGEERGDWFMEAENVRKLDAKLLSYGRMIDRIHPFYIPADTDGGRAEDEEKRMLSLAEGKGLSIRMFEHDDIERFREGAPYPKAFTFQEQAPDMLGVAAAEGETILGMAGASADSPVMWQIGIDVEGEARGKGIAALLVTIIKDELLQRGVLPYYGTAVSHINSQKVAWHAGFMPAWAELTTMIRKNE